MRGKFWGGRPHRDCRIKPPPMEPTRAWQSRAALIGTDRRPGTGDQFDLPPKS
jgi:hypothetical protein